MKILFAVDKTRFFYIQQFIDELEKHNLTCKLIDDLDIYDDSKFTKKYLGMCILLCRKSVMAIKLANT